MNPDLEKLASRPEYFPPKPGVGRGVCDDSHSPHFLEGACKNWRQTEVTPDMNADSRRRAVEMTEQVKLVMEERMLALMDKAYNYGRITGGQRVELVAAIKEELWPAEIAREAQK